MSEVYIWGCGAVSPAGWGADALLDAVEKGEPLPAKDLPRPGSERPLAVRPLPPRAHRPAFLSHPRLRRTSAIAQHTVAAALEALGAETAATMSRPDLGVIVTVMNGCVSYSRRFYDETLKDPSTASPLVFPETVFNAPASHLAAVLGSTAISYTLVGDPGSFLQGLAVAADWILSGRVNGCLVVGAEELDWLTTEAVIIFDRKLIVSEGAGALFLRRERPPKGAVQLEAITESFPFAQGEGRAQAAQAARNELGQNGAGGVLFDGLQGRPRIDEAEKIAWNDWNGPRFSPKQILGEGLMAAAAWQCVAAVKALERNRFRSATVSVVGPNEQAIAARFRAVV